MAGFFVNALADYLARVARHRFAYGALDCCTFMADWLVSRGLPDPMSDRRGTYATYEEFRRAMRSEGGIDSSCARRFTSIGLIEVDCGRAGDVCLVNVPVRLRNGHQTTAPAGAIAVTDRLRAVVTADAGLVIASPPILRAWSHA